MALPVTAGLITLTNGEEATSVSIAYDAAFYQRVAAIATTTAYAVCREDDSATIAGHALRANRALVWLAQCSTPASQVALAIAVTAANTITESSTSQEIADQLALIWDTLSGN